LPRLWLPKREDLHHIEAIPSLGTGKTDLRRVKQMAAEVAARGRMTVAGTQVEEARL
jgi:acyl-[acyl-carrier-protein]-phospholipid O-acyltransferase / long-chain-fatty-acid--[acyl-carrier-protein] ligase